MYAILNVVWNNLDIVGILIKTNHKPMEKIVIVPWIFINIWVPPPLEVLPPHPTYTPVMISDCVLVTKIV